MKFNMVNVAEEIWGCISQFSLRTQCEQKRKNGTDTAVANTTGNKEYKKTEM